MSNDYISKEVEKIIKDDSLEYPLNLAMAAAWICGNLKGINLKILNTKNTTSLSDYFVIASATNTTQAASMAEDVMSQLKKHGSTIRSREGLSGSDWILIDFGDILVHIFLETSRDVYSLESLWKDAHSVEIPQEYYFSSDEAQVKKSDDRGFF